MNRNHTSRLDALAAALRLSRTPSARTIAERLGERTGLHPGEILAEARRIRADAGPHATPDHLATIIANDVGITVDELHARADALLEGIDL